MSRSKTRALRKIIFVTGTDTGVGKTLLTGLLLHYLRQKGVHALAMKPVCSGSRDDALLLAALQDNELALEEVNPFHFAEPLAPLVAGRKRGKTLSLRQVLSAIHRVQHRCDVLLVEGIGGVLVPLGEKWTVKDLIFNLECEVVVVSRNRLGTINHTLLTMEALKRAGIGRVKLVLMDEQKADYSSRSNHLIVSELLRQIPTFRVPFLGPAAAQKHCVKKTFKKTKKTLAPILA